MMARLSFVQKLRRSFAVLDQQAVSDVAQLCQSCLFTLLDMISVAYL